MNTGAPQDHYGAVRDEGRPAARGPVPNDAGPLACQERLVAGFDLERTFDPEIQDRIAVDSDRTPPHLSAGDCADDGSD